MLVISKLIRLVELMLEITNVEKTNIEITYKVSVVQITETEIST